MRMPHRTPEDAATGSLRVYRTPREHFNGTHTVTTREVVMQRYIIIAPSRMGRGFLSRKEVKKKASCPGGVGGNKGNFIR